jgi:hypothetical protein
MAWPLKSQYRVEISNVASFGPQHEAIGGLLCIRSRKFWLDKRQEICPGTVVTVKTDFWHTNCTYTYVSATNFTLKSGSELRIIVYTGSCTVNNPICVLHSRAEVFHQLNDNSDARFAHTAHCFSTRQKATAITRQESRGFNGRAGVRQTPQSPISKTVHSR